MIWQTFISGVPKPQGSKSAGRKKNGGTYLREDNAGTKPWRKHVVAELQNNGVPPVRFDSAVWVRLRFVFLRPKSHPRNSLPTSKRLGDVDKLTRNMLDALTQAGVITDDRFVVKLRDVEKVYGPNPGVHIEIGSAVPNPFSGVGSPITVDAAAVGMEIPVSAPDNYGRVTPKPDAMCNVTDCGSPPYCDAGLCVHDRK